MGGVGYAISTLLEDGGWRMDRPKYLPKTGDSYTHSQTNLYT